MSGGHCSQVAKLDFTQTQGATPLGSDWMTRKRYSIGRDQPIQGSAGSVIASHELFESGRDKVSSGDDATHTIVLVHDEDVPQR